MSQGSAIEWTDATWNPVAGCSLVSPGCTNCYAMRMAARLARMGQAKYAGTTREVNGHHVWTGQIILDETALPIPLSWKKPRRVFVNSMSDLFHESVPFEFIARVFAVMSLANWHQFQILTKRDGRMADVLASAEFQDAVTEASGEFDGFADEQAPPTGGRRRQPRWPLRHVWLGTSVENQEAADERIPHLLRCPAAVRFLSCEPLLDDIWLSGKQDIRSDDAASHEWQEWLRGKVCSESPTHGYREFDAPGIDWVIVGGESGPGARPCDVAWIRSIVRQCKAAGVPVFVKQLGARPIRPVGNACMPWVKRLRDPKGGNIAEFPADLRIRELPQEIE